LFSKFSKQVNTIFVDKNSSHFTVLGKVNIILSPSLYWVKKVALPVKYIRDVKTLMPSLFEDSLSKGIYNYSAYKSDDEFCIFAYEDKMILDTLHKKGISSSQINNVYFAQSEFSHINEAIKIDENSSLFLKDEVLALLPSTWFKDAIDLDLSTITLSKHKITLKQFSHLVNEKSLYTLFGIGLLFLVLTLSEYFITLDKITIANAKKEAIFEKHGLKSTMFQNEALLKDFKQKHKTQTKFRDSISKLLTLKLSKNVKLSLIELKGKKFKVEFDGLKAKDEAILKRELKSKKIKFRSIYKKKQLRLEITL